jgi:hypothetical protein
MIATTDEEALVHGADPRFVPIGEEQYPPGRLAEIFELLWTVGVILYIRQQQRRLK